jgi:hypothetical protein
MAEKKISPKEPAKSKSKTSKQEKTPAARVTKSLHRRSLHRR